MLPKQRSITFTAVRLPDGTFEIQFKQDIKGGYTIVDLISESIILTDCFVEAMSKANINAIKDGLERENISKN